MSAEIKILPVGIPDTPDHIFQFIQGLLALAYKQEILKIEVRYLTREDGWVPIKLG